jgi:hypothetical protein
MQFRFLLALALVICSAYATDESAIVDDKPSSEAENIIAGNEEQNRSMASDIAKSVSSGHINISGYDISYEIIGGIIAILTGSAVILEKTYHVLSKIKDRFGEWHQRRIRRGESQESKPKAKIINVPELPPHFLPRPEDLDRIKDLILSKADEPVVVTGASKVGLQGMGGIGKSVMAAAVARDKDTQHAFPDGILWLTLGINPKLAQRQSDLAVMLGDVPHAFNDPQEGRSHLSKLLADKVCLIILDDVWKVEHLEGFNILGSSSKMMITTRDAKIITALGAQEYRLGVLDDEEAMKLLATWAGQSKEDLPPEALKVANECGNLPLALAMVGAMVRGMPELWKVALDRLKNADLDKIEQQFPDYPYTDLLKAIQVSVDALEPELQERYLDFAVFPEDIPIPEAALQTFWDGKEFTPAEVIGLLVNRSLLLKDDNGRLSLHDLQFDYVKKQAGDLRSRHDQLLESYCAKYLNIGKSPKSWAEGPNDGYFFQHLALHLKEAGREDELQALLMDFDWIRAKLAATDVPSLLVDYDLLADPDAGLVRDALRLSSHVIAADKAQLASQILGRLMVLPSPPIQALIDGAVKKGDEPWIRPLTPNLMPPGTPLLRTLKGHSNWVSAVAVSPDGRMAVSGSRDNTLKVWDLERGEEIRTLKGHSNWVSAVAVSPDGRMAVSGSWDNTLKVWDLERGEEIRTLKGHSNWVSAVAVSPDGRMAVSGSRDNTLKVWDLERGEVVATFTGESSILCCAIGPDGVTIAAGESSGRVHFLRLENAQLHS